MNLYEETLAVLKGNNISTSQIKWIGCDDFRISWDNFVEIAKKTDCDPDSEVRIAMDLMIVGIGWWMAINSDEYDGSQYWYFYRTPEEPRELKHIQQLSGSLGSSLNDLNE